MKEVDQRQSDCILQLGDFNYATRQSQECMDLWRQYHGPRYHVLGNHDMDFPTTEESVAFWSMPARYNSFNVGGYHFVVLDRNNLKAPDGYVPYARANFYVDAPMRGHADPEQIEWLRDDLRSTSLPTVVFVHQGLGMHNEPYPAGDARGH
jgi:calcineurin-like phosphoesterase family protein